MAFWQSLHRLVYIAFVITKHGLAHAWGVLRTRLPEFVSARSQVGLSGPERLRTALEDLGGSFIKFGQMLALQPDILSLEYCNALFDLLDRITPFEYADVERIFVQEVGKTPAEIFDSFEPVPLATASIGQVHVAQLNGRKVAVKVQRPSVDTDFAGDIRLMVATIRIIKALRWKLVYWMIEPMSEFVSWTEEELDYRCEARYMEQLRRNAENNLNERVPEVIWQHSTRRILVTEFIEGDTVLAYLRAMETNDELMSHRLKSSGFEAHQVAQHIIDNFLGDAFQHGMFHADLHPANLMILPNNVIGYIDFGITGAVSQYARQSLVALTLAYTRGDLAGMCAAVLKVSAMDSSSNVAGYQQGLRRLESEWYERRGTERRLLKNFSLVMLDMLILARKTNIWPERGVIKYIRSAIAIDGLITRFASNFNVGMHLQTVCDRFLKMQARSALFSYHSMVEWPISNTHLMKDGWLRAGDFLQRVTHGGLPAHGEIRGATHDPSSLLRSRATRLSVVAVSVSLLMVGSGERVQLGTNLFTAEALLILVSTTMLLLTVWRLKAAG